MEATSVTVNKGQDFSDTCSLLNVVSHSSLLYLFSKYHFSIRETTQTFWQNYSSREYQSNPKCQGVILLQILLEIRGWFLHFSLLPFPPYFFSPHRQWAEFVYSRSNLSIYLDHQNSCMVVNFHPHIWLWHQGMPGYVMFFALIKWIQ